MKKTLLAVAIPTLALTGCFGSGSNATYVAPTPQVKPTPDTHTGTKPSTENTAKPSKDTAKPSQNTTNPSVNISGNHSIPGNTSKPAPTPAPTPRPSDDTSKPAPTPEAGKPAPDANVSKPNISVPTDIQVNQAQAKQAYEAAVAVISQPDYQKLVKDKSQQKIDFQILNNAVAGYIENKSELDKLEVNLYKAVLDINNNETAIANTETKLEKLKQDKINAIGTGNESLADTIDEKITAAEKSLKGFKDKTSKLEADKVKAETLKAVTAKVVKTNKESIDIAKQQYLNNPEAQKFVTAVIATVEKLEADEMLKDKTLKASARALKVAEKSVDNLTEEYEELKDSYVTKEVEAYESLFNELKAAKETGKQDDIAKKLARVNEYVSSKSLQPVHELKTKLAEAEEAKDKLIKKDTALKNFYGTVTGHVDFDTEASGSDKDTVNGKAIASLVSNPSSRISVSLSNAAHGFYENKYFYQGYATPEKYLMDLKKTDVAHQAVYVGDAFVKNAQDAVTKGSSEFNVTFGTNSTSGNINGVISYGNSKIVLADGTFNGNAKFTGTNFKGSFYGQKAEELAGSFKDDAKSQTGTFGASRK